MAGGAGVHGILPCLLDVSVDVGADVVVELVEPGVGGVGLTQQVSLLNKEASFWCQAGLIVVHFASWNVGFGSFEEDLSEDPLSLGD